MVKKLKYYSYTAYLFMLLDMSYFIVFAYVIIFFILLLQNKMRYRFYFGLFSLISNLVKISIWSRGTFFINLR